MRQSRMTGSATSEWGNLIVRGVTAMKFVRSSSTVELAIVTIVDERDFCPGLWWPDRVCTRRNAHAQIASRVTVKNGPKGHHCYTEISNRNFVISSCMAK
jgi:hypothetical protein